MLPRRGSICGRLTSDLPLGYLQGGWGCRSERWSASSAKTCSDTSNPRTTRSRVACAHLCLSVQSIRHGGEHTSTPGTRYHPPWLVSLENTRPSLLPQHFGQGEAAAPRRSAGTRRRRSRPRGPSQCACVRASRTASCSPREWRTARDTRPNNTVSFHAAPPDPMPAQPISGYQTSKSTPLPQHPSTSLSASHDRKRLSR